MKSEKIRVWAVAVVSAVIIIGIAVANVATKPGQKDAEGCDADVAGKTVILLDQTESISKQTAAEIVTRVKNLVNTEVKVGELVSVFSVSDLSKKSLVPLFSYCKPPDTAKGIGESQRYISKKFEKHFAQPLQAVLATPISGSKESPIAQSIIDLSLSDFLRHPHARLVIFSDLMEYTERFKTYDCRDPKSAISRFRMARGAAVARPSFHNTRIYANIIPRSAISAETSACNQVFWNWFFGDNDGPNAAFDSSYLPG